MDFCYLDDSNSGIVNQQLTEDTQRFLRDLKWFLLHVALYVAVNLLLSLVVFSNFQTNWWLLLPMITWAIALIFHAIQMADKKRRVRLRALLSSMLIMR